MKRILAGFLFLMILNSSIKSQSGESPLKQVNFASPEAAMFGKFDNINVSNYSGVPDISILLYTIKERDFQLPIVLRYHSSGIKVDEEATWVGLGWDLSIGGHINHVPVGMSDDLNNTFLQTIEGGLKKFNGGIPRCISKYSFRLYLKRRTRSIMESMCATTASK